MNPQGVNVFTRMLYLNEVRCGPVLLFTSVAARRYPCRAQKTVAAIRVSQRESFFHFT